MDKSFYSFLGKYFSLQFDGFIQANI